MIKEIAIVEYEALFKFSICISAASAEAFERN
jgi:hypothetical protein